MAYEQYVLVCGGTACCSGGGTAVVEEFKKELEAAGLSEKTQVVWSKTPSEMIQNTKWFKAFHQVV